MNGWPRIPTQLRKRDRSSRHYIRVKFYRKPFCLDTETERLIQDASRLLLQDRTSIIVANRRSTIQFVDRTLVIHKDRIRVEGTHDNLLAKQGLYYRMDQLHHQLS